MRQCYRFALHLALITGTVARFGVHVDAVQADPIHNEKDNNITTAKSSLLAGKQNLEALWRRELSRSRMEAVRFLQRQDFSMRPTRAPVKAPVLPPSTAVPTPTTYTPPPTSIVSTEAPVAQDAPTIAPTATPAPTDCLLGQSLRDRLLEILTPITDRTLLLNAATPQGMAFSFMENDPYVQKTICDNMTLEQRYGLATVYFATDGAKWSNAYNWLKPVHECEWAVSQVLRCEGMRATLLDLSMSPSLCCVALWQCPVHFPFLHHLRLPQIPITCTELFLMRSLLSTF